MSCKIISQISRAPSREGAYLREVGDAKDLRCEASMLGRRHLAEKPRDWRPKPGAHSRVQLVQYHDGRAAPAKTACMHHEPDHR